MEIIRLEGLKKMYSGGQRAVNDISLSINNKEKVLLYGAPGSGKSTLMRLVAGLEAPDDGKVIVMDKAVHEMTSDEASLFRNLNFGIVQRSPGFLKGLNILENVALPLTLRSAAPSKTILAAKQQLKAFGLLYVAHAYPEQISKFEAQIASLARALIGGPKILLLDEITAGLSSKETDQILSILLDAWKFGDFVIINFSGSKKSVFHADRYFTLDHGRIQEDIS